MIWLTAGEEMTVGDLLKGLIVGNANDAAVVLAVAAGGDAETFVMDMNARAFDLGMRDTRSPVPRAARTTGRIPRRQIWHGSAALWRNRNVSGNISAPGGTFSGATPPNW